MYRSRRQAASRGAAAVETAMVMPVFLGILGVVITLGLANMVRFLMMDDVHKAVHTCATHIDVISNRISVQSCIQSTINASANRAFQQNICELSNPQVEGPSLVRNQWPLTYLVRATRTCTFAKGGWFLEALWGYTPRFQVVASDSALMTPRYPP